MNRLSHEKIAAIARWLKRGLSIRETAKVSGSDRNTVLAYKKAIERGEEFAPLAEPYLNDAKAMRLTHKVRPSVIERLDDEAEQRGLTRQQISERIIEIVVKDDLFDAVLGE